MPGGGRVWREANLSQAVLSSCPDASKPPPLHHSYALAREEELLLGKRSSARLLAHGWLS